MRHRRPGRRGALRWVWDTVLFYTVLTLLAAAFLTWSLLAVPLAPLLPKRFGAKLGRKVIRAGFRSFLEIAGWTALIEADLEPLEALRHERGLVIVANHPALLDIFLLASRLPNTVCIVKASLFHNPMLGGAKLAGYIRNDAPLPMIRRAGAVLRAGVNLLIFPEGTRSRDGVVGPFRPGFAAIARAAGAPVQVVFIQGDTPYLEKGWPLWRRPPLPLRYRVRLGPRLRVEGRAELFAASLREVFVAALGAPDLAAARDTGAAAPRDAGARPPREAGAAPLRDTGAAAPWEDGGLPGDAGLVLPGDTDTAPMRDLDTAPPRAAHAAPVPGPGTAPMRRADAALPGAADAAPLRDDATAQPADWPASGSEPGR